METGEIIKKLRKERGWNQTELGEKIGLTYGGVASIEQGRADPTKKITLKLAEVFGVSTDYLLIGKESSGELSEEEREILDFVRKDKDFSDTIKQAAKLKKKAINYFRNYKLHSPMGEIRT